MKKYKMRCLPVFVAAAAIAVTASQPVSAYTVNESNNAYYKEVSGIVHALTAPFKDGRERDCCYSSMMTGVFGGHFNDWDYHKGEYDLIYVLDANEPNLLLSEFLIMNGAVKYLDWGDGKHYYCMYDKLPLNESGINEQNYNSLKSIYQAAETLKAQTDGMNVTEKAKVIHDYMIARYAPGSKKDLNEHGAIWMEASGTGVCSAYMQMFLLLGRYCGLDVGSIEYWMNQNTMHTFNTVILENGETRCVDVFWDDIKGNGNYFMETVERNLVSHPRLQGGGDLPIKSRGGTAIAG